MYGSKFDTDLDDDCSCEEIIVSKPPESYYCRKKEKDMSYQRSIDKFDPCVCPEGDFQYVKSIKREIVKPSSALKDLCTVDMDNSKKKRNKNRTTTKKRSKTHRTKEIYDTDCSIIYTNKFEDDEQYLCSFEARRTQEDIEWTGSDISISTFPIIEEQNKCPGICNTEKREDIRSKDPFADIPSIPPCNLPELVERKPEPEVLATVLLLSEKDDLREVKPNVIFDKLFLDSTSRQNFTTDMVNTKTTNTDDRTLDDTQTERFGEESMDIDLTEYRSLPQNSKDNTQEKWTKEDILKYMMKAEVTPYRNYVRLNGSVKPSWFPGYAFVSPLIPNCIRITSDPGEGLLEAWRLCRPRHFDEFSKSFLNTA
ncbi:hypothetical protein V1477_001997 [Vespula maculifrons]|uniref:Uncharacterized protein n=1 Tax=Vespula maculifrons TaxID=7453 RepID=A0ABD2CY37_VESMC